MVTKRFDFMRISNITRKEAMGIREGGQDDLRNYPLTPGECSRSFMERDGAEIKAPKNLDVLKELFSEPNPNLRHELDWVRGEMGILRAKLAEYKSTESELMCKIFVEETGINVGTKYSLEEDKGEVVRLDCSLSYVCPVVKFDCKFQGKEILIHPWWLRDLVIIKD